MTVRRRGPRTIACPMAVARDCTVMTTTRRRRRGQSMCTRHRLYRQVYDWRLAGVSCCEIARRLNRKGIPSKRGGKWSAGTVRTMLRNEAYTGVQFWGKKRYQKIYGLWRGRREEREEARGHSEAAGMGVDQDGSLFAGDYRAADFPGCSGGDGQQSSARKALGITSLRISSSMGRVTVRSVGLLKRRVSIEMALIRTIGAGGRSPTFLAPRCGPRSAAWSRCGPTSWSLLYVNISSGR